MHWGTGGSPAWNHLARIRSSQDYRQGRRGSPPGRYLDQNPRLARATSLFSLGPWRRSRTQIDKSETKKTKPEIRSSKFETNPKSESEILKLGGFRTFPSFEFRICFVFRVSLFGFQPTGR